MDELIEHIHGGFAWLHSEPGDMFGDELDKSMKDALQLSIHEQEILKNLCDQFRRDPTGANCGLMEDQRAIRDAAHDSYRKLSDMWWRQNPL